MYEEDEKRALREAFERVRNDIFTLGNEFTSIKNDIFELKSIISSFNSRLNPLESHFQSSNEQHSPQTIQHITPTHPISPSNNPTVPCEIGGLNSQDFNSSTGNGGVPTDRQTIQQTDNPTHFYSKNSDLVSEKTVDETITAASELLSSLDSIKKEIRRKFKNITTQEMLVFSTIYQLEDQFGETDYRILATKLELSESSIRDYVHRLIGKGIPIVKNKLNNKKITLGISPNLRKIAPLQTITRLREL